MADGRRVIGRRLTGHLQTADRWLARRLTGHLQTADRWLEHGLQVTCRRQTGDWQTAYRSLADGRQVIGRRLTGHLQTQTGGWQTTVRWFQTTDSRLAHGRQLISILQSGDWPTAAWWLADGRRVIGRSPPGDFQTAAWWLADDRHVIKLGTKSHVYLINQGRIHILYERRIPTLPINLNISQKCILKFDVCSERANICLLFQRPT